MTATEVSDSLERVDDILDEIMDDMEGFSNARTWRYVMRETYESPEDNKGD
jgi:hypothetical protein